MSDADAAFAAETIAGLTAEKKMISSKWLYDTYGSELFEKITQLDDYYPTRTEARIFETVFPQLPGIIGPDAAIIEYGSGASIKTRNLMTALQPAVYVPIDIAAEFLADAVDQLEALFPSLRIDPLVADITKPVTPPPAFLACDNRLAFFPGSTIGNFYEGNAVRFLARVRETVGEGAYFLVCADLVKAKEVLERAYDDSEGVTAAFNLNLLTRMNNELGGDFDLARFRHVALFNEQESRIEMHIEALQDQQVAVAGKTISFRKGERIHTENSYKYTEESFRAMAEAGGWEVRNFWTDENRYFGVWLLGS